jgi:uncharacterized membrane protein
MVIFLLVLPLLYVTWRMRGKRLPRLVVGIRLVVTTLIILSLTDPILGQAPPPSTPLVVLADQSDSLTEVGKATLRARSARLATPPEKADTALQSQRPVVTLWFGENTVVPDEWSTVAAELPVPESLLQPIEPSASDIAGGIRVARELVSGAGGQIILLSDGLQTRGDALQEAKNAAAAGVRIDVWPLAPPQDVDIRIAGVYVPPFLHVGEEYRVQIDIDMMQGLTTTPPQHAPIPATLKLWERSPDSNGEKRLLGEEQITLNPGRNTTFFRSTINASGVVRFTAEVSMVPASPNDTIDIFADNNTGAAASVVTPPSRVLLVEGQGGNASELSSALWQTGIESNVIVAQDLPTRLSNLQEYNGMVLVDVSAYDLSLDQMSSVREFVRSEGRGLVVVGGTQSYGLGSYKDTPLDSLLPISVDPPPHHQRTNVALLLMIDRSASMSVPQDISKFDMAKEAAILATESLQSEDRIGILAFDTKQDWTIPFQVIGEGLSQKQIQDTIVMLEVGGGTDIYGALTTGLSQLMKQDVEVRHAVLLTDGRSFTNDSDAYQQLIQQIRDQGSTLSSIAIGLDADRELLQQLADWGNGRYYFADEPQDIPRLTLQESEIARTNPSVEGNFNVVLENAHPLLHGFNPSEMPALTGYVATSRKPSAEVVLQSPSGDPTKADPLLATWQYGLGRVVAWTPSLGAPWASAWGAWPDFARFWSQVVRYTLPEDPNSSLSVAVEQSAQAGEGGKGMQLVVDAIKPSGEPMNLADGIARVILPDGTSHDILLRQTAPGRYIQDIVLPTPGPYTIIVVVDHEGQRYQTRIGYIHPTPEEYTAPSQSAELHGQPLLEQIAATTGGSILTEETIPPDLLQSAAQEDDTFGFLEYQMWPWLLGAALLIWLVEIGLRRT